MSLEKNSCGRATSLNRIEFGFCQKIKRPPPRDIRRSRKNMRPG